MATNKNMRGALFVNDKGGVETRPDFRGDIVIDGVVSRLSAWKQEYAKGNFISIEVSKEEKVEV